MSYVELHCKSNFSFLTGASHPEELVDEAIKLGLKGLALTDVNGLYGVVRAFKAAQKAADFRFIVGAELKLSDHSHIVLLAKDHAGYQKLCRLITKAHADKEKGEAQLRFQELIDYLAEGAPGLIALVSSLGTTHYAHLKEIFAEELYIPLTFYLDGFDRKRCAQAQQLSKQHQIPLIASNDVTYHQKQRKIIQDTLIAIRAGVPLSRAGYQLFSNAERYLKSPAQMFKLYEEFPEALARTLEIATACTFSLKELHYTYPSEWIPQGQTAQSYLEALVQRHAPNRYPNGLPENVARQLNHELKLIRELKYADYFLTLYDIVEFAKRQKILCQGRGSAANSAVCYVLGITAIDPIKMNLLFERFISAERGEPPDIDVDFEHERREEVIQYIYNKYGRERAGMVSAVVTYRGRSAFREVCKAFGVPVGTLSAKAVERDFEKLTRELPHNNKLRERIRAVVLTIQGFPRHLTIHSGGFTLSAAPIIDMVPVEPARMPGRTIIQWDKYDLDALGLLKVDILALGMLSALRKSLDQVGLQLHEIPHDDPATYQMIQNADTVGTFQIESRAQMSMLGRLQPKDFYDLVIEVAIMRPGPIVGQMVHPYLKRRRGLEPVLFPNSKVETILGKTLGIPLFQEQVMRLAIELAHFTPGEADQLRRSINAWRSSAPIAKMATRLMQGLIDSGLPRPFAQQIFDQIQGFSMYGFPESHAASFALLAYASGYLKCHYPATYACALINSQPMGFYRVDTILYDAIRHGIQLLPVSFQYSQWDCEALDQQTIRLGFRVVQGVSQAAIDKLIAERAQTPFTNLQDIFQRTSIRKDVLERMAMAGGFDEFALAPRQALWSLLKVQLHRERGESQQLGLFSKTASEVDKNHFAELNRFELVQQDYQAYSLSTHGHPMSELRRMMQWLPRPHSKIIKNMLHGTRVATSGMVLLRQRPPTAKGVVFSTLEDEFGFIDLILHAPTFERYKEVFLNHCFLVVQGTLQRDEKTVSLLVNRAEPIWKTASMDETPLAIEPTQYFHTIIV